MEGTAGSPIQQRLRHIIPAIVCLFASLHPQGARAEDLAGITGEKYRVSVRHVSPKLISPVEAPLITTNGRLALINDNRHLWWLDAMHLKLEALESTAVAHESTWYGPACAHANGFVIAVSDYPDPQKDTEAETPRGGYRAGPSPRGVLILDRSGLHRHLPALSVRSHPPVPSPQSGSTEESEELFHFTPPTVFNHLILSCARQRDKLMFGAYGALGTADVEHGTMDLVQHDYELNFNRVPLWIDASGIWFGIDEGGMGGAGLDHLRGSGDERHYSIRAQEDGDIVVVTALVRHRGHMMVGTTHGLFRLDERTGSFSRLDFRHTWSNAMVTDLVSHQGFLWSFQGGHWLRIDIRARHAVRYAPAQPAKFEMGRPFGKGWLLSSEHGVWAYRVR